MKFKDLKNKIKEEQKSLAQQIIRGKYLRKPCQRDDITTEEKRNFFTMGYFDDYKLFKLRFDYRHRHVAYCSLFNNTPYDKIENPRKFNEIREGFIDKYKKEWEKELDEDVHSCS